MMHDRIIQALGRIEISLSRLEARPNAAPVSPDDLALRAKHDRLKSEAQAAIVQIDQILGKLEG